MADFYWRDIVLLSPTVSSKESRHSSCKLQVVFPDLLIVGRLDVDGQSSAPIGLHKTDASSDLFLIKRHCIGTKGLPGSNYKTNWIK